MAREYYEKKAHSYMKYQNDDFANYIFAIISEQLKELPSVAVEIGAGMGRFSQPLIDNYEKAFLVEPSTTFCDKLTEKFKDKNVTIHNSTFQKFLNDFSCNGSMTIFAFHLMHHLSKEQRKELYRYVKKFRSTFVFVEPNPYNPLLLLQLFVEKDMRFFDEIQYVRLRKNVHRHEIMESGLALQLHKYICPLPPVVLKRLLGSQHAGIVKKLEAGINFFPQLASYQLFIVK